MQAFFSGALIMPVLTAHPTEVQRKSILDCLRDIAVLLDERDRIPLTPAEQAHNEDGLRRADSHALADPGFARADAFGAR